MAKRTKKFNAKDWIKAYKDHLLQYGELAKDIKTLLHFTDRHFVDFKTHFEDIESLESAIVCSYFEDSLKVLAKDKNFNELSSKEQHLAFLYVLMEVISNDEIFLESMQQDKMKDPGFIFNLQKKLNKLNINWGEIEGWKPEILEKLNLNPKQSVYVNHAITCILFYLKDKSEEKQDTDAFIEKTTDLLFKLSDTSTLNSMLDLGKFMYSRSKASFS